MACEKQNKKDRYIVFSLFGYEFDCCMFGILGDSRSDINKYTCFRKYIVFGMRYHMVHQV